MILEWMVWMKAGWLILRFIFADDHTYRYKSYSYADYWMNMKVKGKISTSDVLKAEVLIFKNWKLNEINLTNF